MENLRTEKNNNRGRGLRIVVKKDSKGRNIGYDVASFFFMDEFERLQAEITSNLAVIEEEKKQALEAEKEAKFNELYSREHYINAFNFLTHKKLLNGDIEDSEAYIDAFDISTQEDITPTQIKSTIYNNEEFKDIFVFIYGKESD